VLVLGKDGELWRYRREQRRPELLLSFSKASRSLAVSQDGRWFVAYLDPGKLALWDLEKTGPLERVNERKIRWGAWLAVVGEGENVRIACGAGSEPAGRALYSVPELEPMEAATELPPPARNYDGSEVLVSGGGRLTAFGGTMKFFKNEGSQGKAVGERVLPGCFGWLPEGEAVWVDWTGGLHQRAFKAAADD
jgi:hypothetical protein